MKVIWAPERTRARERLAREEEALSRPSRFSLARPVFLRLLRRPSFFVPLIVIKKTSCGIRCLYFESTIHSFIFGKSQHVQLFENFIQMRFKWHRLERVNTCHILRAVYTYNFFLHFPAQVLVQV